MPPCSSKFEEFHLSEKPKVMHDVAMEQVEFTVGVALIIWSFFNILFLIFFPLVGAYLIIRSVTNILRAIRDGE